MPLGQSLAKLAFWLITIAALINLTGPPTRSLFEQFLVGEAKRRHGTEPSPLHQTGGALHPNPRLDLFDAPRPWRASPGPFLLSADRQFSIRGCALVQLCRWRQPQPRRQRGRQSGRLPMQPHQLLISLACTRLYLAQRRLEPLAVQRRRHEAFQKRFGTARPARPPAEGQLIPELPLLGGKPF